MPRLILFNKPFGVLSQFTDKGTEGSPRKTLSDFITMPGVYAAGRLDQDSEGLLVLTDDGQLQNRISDPKFKQPKTLKDGKTAPAKAQAIPEPENLWPRDPPIRVRKSVPDSWISLTITEGRNRQVRRMTAAVGHPTLRLIRAQVGEWTLNGLATGKWRDTKA